MRSTCREALVHLLTELRPSWGSEGIRRCLNDPSLAMVSEEKTSLVFVKAALDVRIKTPGGALQPGSHWDEAGAPTPLPKYRDPFNRPAMTDEDRERAALAARAAKATLQSVKGLSFCHHCNTSMPRENVPSHDCGEDQAQ